ncbi:hypothetical protein ABIA00_003257 [Bradyrhizobium ottawaense]|uniref:hypothetical protein n=1 Tax=Bradyrhizobium ottawaense TaxID=931866 RepID=UPI003834C788
MSGNARLVIFEIHFARQVRERIFKAGVKFAFFDARFTAVRTDAMADKYLASARLAVMFPQGSSTIFEPNRVAAPFPLRPCTRRGRSVRNPS